MVDETEAKRLEQEGIIIRLGASSTDTAVTFSEPSPPSSATSSSSASSMSSGVSNNRSMRPRTSTSHSGYASYVNVGDDRYES